jgi:hypothetical protein
VARDLPGRSINTSNVHSLLPCDLWPGREVGTNYFVGVRLLDGKDMTATWIIDASSGTKHVVQGTDSYESINSRGALTTTPFGPRYNELRFNPRSFRRVL